MNALCKNRNKTICKHVNTPANLVKYFANPIELAKEVKNVSKNYTDYMETVD